LVTPTEYFYVRNAQGDIIELIDKAGTQVVSYTYDSWGKLISIKDATGANITNNTTHVGYKNPYRYRGYRYDTETGLYYLQSRYYNPEWGRFINADGIIGQTEELLGHNMFAYTKNNPVRMSDRNGFRPVYTMREETEEMYNNFSEKSIDKLLTEVFCTAVKYIAVSQLAQVQGVLMAWDAEITWLDENTVARPKGILPKRLPDEDIKK